MGQAVLCDQWEGANMRKVAGGMVTSVVRVCACFPLINSIFSVK